MRIDENYTKNKQTNKTSKRRTINYLCITSWLQIFRFFVAEWVLQHNHPLFPLSRAISHENVF